MIEVLTIVTFSIVALIAGAAIYCWAAIEDMMKGEAR